MPPLLPVFVLVAAWVGLAFTGSLARQPQVFLALYALAFGAWAGCVRRLRRRGAAPRLGVVLLVAALLRLLALPLDASDDVNRYLWEGRVANAGFDPYQQAPDAAVLAPMAASDPFHPGINHKGWTAIYPPLAMLWHQAVAALAYGPMGVKLSLLLAEAALVGLLVGLLRARQLDPRRVLIYAWNPLAVLVVAGQGHHDVLAAALLVGGLLALERGRGGGAVAALAAAALAKLVALAALPALLGRVRPRAWWWSVAVLLVVLAPFADSAAGLGTSLLRFGTQMHFNDSLHALAAAALGPAAARWTMAIAWLGLAAWVVGRKGDPVRSAAFLLAAALLVLPTMHPWYLLPLLPLLCCFPWWGWLALTGTAVLAYLPQVAARAGGTWTEWRPGKLLEYAPLFAWLAAVAFRRWRGNRDAAR